jgi:hypothetical protein
MAAEDKKQKQITFDKSAFHAKFSAVVKDKGLLHINPTKINTSEDAWALYNDMKKLAHAELNQGCSMHLQGKEDSARRCFAFCWQQRSVCDWLFQHLKPHPRAAHAPTDEARKHTHMMDTLENALQALCTDKDGKVRATCPRETYVKYSKPFS